MHVLLLSLLLFHSMTICFFNKIENRMKSSMQKLTGCECGMPGLLYLYGNWAGINQRISIYEFIYYLHVECVCALWMRTNCVRCSALASVCVCCVHVSVVRLVARHCLSQQQKNIRFESGAALCCSELSFFRVKETTIRTHVLAIKINTRNWHGHSTWVSMPEAYHTGEYDRFLFVWKRRLDTVNTSKFIVFCHYFVFAFVRMSECDQTNNNYCCWLLGWHFFFIILSS